MKLLPSRKMCEILNVYPNTLRNWEKNGKINCIGTPTNQRLYDLDAFLEAVTKVKK